MTPGVWSILRRDGGWVDDAAQVKVDHLPTVNVVDGAHDSTERQDMKFDVDARFKHIQVVPMLDQGKSSNEIVQAHEHVHIQTIMQ